MYGGYGSLVGLVKILVSPTFVWLSFFKKTPLWRFCKEGAALGLRRGRFGDNVIKRALIANRPNYRVNTKESGF